MPATAAPATVTPPRAARPRTDSVVGVSDNRGGEISAGADLTYEPPRGLGLAAPPALRVAEPHRIDPDREATNPIEPVVVSPEFDVLIPAFDWEALSNDDILPPVERRPSETPAGSGTGTLG